MQSGRVHYNVTRVNNQHTTVVPGDTFVFNVQVLYFPLLPGWLEHQFSPRSISSQEFFQEGQNFLRTTLSHSRFFIESLEELAEEIVAYVRQMFHVGSLSDFLSLESQHRIIPLTLAILIMNNGEHAASEESSQSSTIILRETSSIMVNNPSDEAIINKFLKKCTVMTGSEDCCICLEDLNINAECYTMPCQHAFHLPCILTWLKISHVCPLCRYSLPIL